MKANLLCSRLAWVPGCSSRAVWMRGSLLLALYSWHKSDRLHLRLSSFLVKRSTSGMPADTVLLKSSLHTTLPLTTLLLAPLHSSLQLCKASLHPFMLPLGTPKHSARLLTWYLASQHQVDTLEVCMGRNMTDNGCDGRAGPAFTHEDNTLSLEMDCRSLVPYAP